ncbi:MAG: hypothetical protein KatS3mg108_1253 [Isosphaeraceae bacterium]|jgi:hypothetical protein|nr:MAG: hypothetical protein KatS3mg108_1253 [Isosphaeraceae bacterium]
MKRAPTLRRHRVTRSYVPRFEAAEARVVPSGLAGTGRVAGLVGQLRPSIRIDPGGAAAILNALNGGLGSEFVRNLRQHVRNPLRIVREFASGQRTSFATRGFAALTHTTLPTYLGGHADAILPRVAGAVALPSNQLSLGAIMRGPMDELNEGARYVWALDLGRGARSIFSEYPDIQADTIVRVDIGQDRRPTLTIDDLVRGTSRSLDPARVRIVGATIRLRLAAADLPVGSAPLRQARFAFWVHETPGGLETVPNFLPTRSIPVGVIGRR